MEHIPLVVDPSFTTLIWVLIGVGAVLGLSGAIGQTVAKRRLWWYVLMGVGFLTLSVPVFLLTHSSSSPDKVHSAWQEQVAEQLNDRYDTKLTVENIESLRYPEETPEGRVPLGTATLPGTGREVALVFNDGRAYLRIIGEELPFD